MDIADATELSMRRGKRWKNDPNNALDKREILRRELLTAARSPQFVTTEQLLRTVPGIGPSWALIITSEIGPFDRFPNADALEFWTAMTADLKESAGRTQSGNITKAAKKAKVKRSARAVQPA
jgi:transposase